MRDERWWHKCVRGGISGDVLNNIFLILVVVQGQKNGTARRVESV